MLRHKKCTRKTVNFSVCACLRVGLCNNFYCTYNIFGIIHFLDKDKKNLCEINIRFGHIYK